MKKRTVGFICLALLLAIPMTAVAVSVMSKLRLSGHHPFRGAFAWADQPSATLGVPYTPDANYAYNFTGAPITIERDATGYYTVTFGNLGTRSGAGTNGGHVQVSAYGTTGVACNVGSWDSFSSTDVQVSVYCFNTATGNMANSYFDISMVF